MKCWFEFNGYGAEYGRDTFNLEKIAGCIVKSQTLLRRKSAVKELIPLEIIENKIFLIRGHRVMLDKDIAALYGVDTRDLNKAVVRNLDRFPEDFMFQLNKDEFQGLMFHFGTSRWGGTRKMPRAFTEQGVAMLSGILSSKRAAWVNIAIMRTFVKLRWIMFANKELGHKLKELEHKIGKHEGDIQLIFEAIRKLMEPPLEKPKPMIGFK